MIVKDRPSWIRLIFAFKGSSLEHVWCRVAFLTFVAGIVTVCHVGIRVGDVRFQITLPSLTVTPFTLVGVALGIFLGFRNNVCYQRFWEGRSLWGGLVNASRSFVRLTLNLIPQPSAGAFVDRGDVSRFQKELTYRLIGYVHSLRHHLRGTSPTAELSLFLASHEADGALAQRNVPLAILNVIGMQLRDAWGRGWIHDQHLSLFQNSLTEITAIQGACEKIKSTPVPFTYTVLIHRIVGAYCFALPFGIVSTVGAMTPLVVAMISVAFLELDAIGDEIEQPFGFQDNDLPLEAISRTIEVNLRQALGETDVPSMLTPKEGLLL